MKNKLLILFSIFVLTPKLVRAQEAPQHRVVYLWDVTNSMHGGYKGGKTSKTVEVAKKPMEVRQYNHKYDIYDEVVKVLILSIRQQSPESEIIVVPFNDKVLRKHIWKAMGTSEGKAFLEKNISEFYNNEETYTNIYAAFDYAKENLFFPKAKYWSDMFVLTDGGHTDQKPPIPSLDNFHRMLREWCDFATPNNVKGYYYLLTDYVYKEDPELKKILEESDCITPFTGIPQGGFTPPTNQFTIKGDQLINIKDQYNQPIRLNVALNNVNHPIQGVEQVRIHAAPNPYLTLDEIVSIDGSAVVEVTPHYSSPLVELQRTMPSENNVAVTLFFEQIKNEKSTNELMNNSCELRYVNKPQKTLSITVK